jgi:hypothetical protein
MSGHFHAKAFLIYVNFYVPVCLCGENLSTW